MRVEIKDGRMTEEVKDRGMRGDTRKERPRLQTEK